MKHATAAGAPKCGPDAVATAVRSGARHTPWRVTCAG